MKMWGKGMGSLVHHPMCQGYGKLWIINDKKYHRNVSKRRWWKNIFDAWTLKIERDEEGIKGMGSLVHHPIMGAVSQISILSISFRGFKHLKKILLGVAPTNFFSSLHSLSHPPITTLYANYRWCCFSHQPDGPLYTLCVAWKWRHLKRSLNDVLQLLVW